MNNIFSKILLALIVFFTSFNLNAFYITMTDPTAINPSYFGIYFADGTSFYAKVDSVMGVSKQKYLLDDLEVTEVIIDFANSNKKLRIFANSLVAEEAEISTDDLDEIFNEANVEDAVGISDVEETQSTYTDSMIVKTSPNITHSNVIEYKVNLEELIMFYYQFCKHDYLNNLKTDSGTRAGTKYVFTSIDTM